VNARVAVRAKLEAKHFNKDGELIRDYGVLSEDASACTADGIVLLALLLLAIAASFNHYLWPVAGLIVFGLVTNVGCIYEATAFSGTGPSVDLLNYHDSGTGSTPAAITDTVLQSPAGGPRVSGLQSSSTNIYETVATINYGSVLLISEWGLFSASSGGTLWDHRVFGAITTAPGDSIQFTYTCLFASGGI
jgi:hypothetical protein